MVFADRKTWGWAMKRGLVLGLLVAISISNPANATGFWGLFAGKKTIKIDPGGMTYNAHLNAGGLPDTLASAINHASLLLSQNETSPPETVEFLNRARGDYRRILAVLYENAFYGAEISIRLNGREAANISLSAILNQPVQVRVVVKPGPKFRFGVVKVQPLARETPPTRGLVSGAVADAGLISSAAKSAVKGWREHGRALARIAGQRLVADHANDLLDVDINVEPGPLTPFGDVTVTGAQRMNRDFLIHMAGLPKGDRFDPEKIALAQKRLVRLGVFRSVRISPADHLAADATLPLALNVVEQPLHRISFGGSVSSSEGGALEGYWLHRNLFGQAERLRFDGAISGIGASGNLAALDYNLGASFTKPGVLGRDTNLNLSATMARSVVGTIDSRNTDLKVGLLRFLPEYSIGLSGFARFSQTRDTAGLHTYRLLGLHIDGLRDTRDDPLDATKGYYLKARLTPFREFGFANTGFRTELEGRGYRALGRNADTVLAGRVIFGSVAGVPLAQSPTDMLFFSGGGNSVRGYAYDSRGVTVGGVFSGGRSVLNLSAELRRRLNETVGIVGFWDAGIVGQGAFPDFSTGVHMGVGAGLRYKTALGPLRIDIARGLNRVAGDPPFVIYLGLGQAF